MPGAPPEHSCPNEHSEEPAIDCPQIPLPISQSPSELEKTYHPHLARSPARLLESKTCVVLPPHLRDSHTRISRSPAWNRQRCSGPRPAPSVPLSKYQA